MDKIAETMSAAREKLRDQQDTIEEQQEKLARFEREKLAEEIVEMQIASGNVDASDFLDKRAELVEGDEDLSQVKTAMKHAGPGYGDSTVEVGDSQEKEASVQSSDASEPDHVKEARSTLEQMAHNL
jgi:hypothetical protein